MSEKVKAKGLSDSIALKGYVTIWQGEGDEKKLVCKRKENHWVDAGIQGLVSALIGQALLAGSTYNVFCWVYDDSLGLYLGTDTAAPTTHSMTELTSPMGTPPGTAPDSLTGADLTNPSSGLFKTSIIALWFAGAVSGTVGELALYMGAFEDLTPDWTESNRVFPSVMASRLSEADGDFSSFGIDPTKSLTVQWDLEVSFA